VHTRMSVQAAGPLLASHTYSHDWRYTVLLACSCSKYYALVPVQARTRTHKHTHSLQCTLYAERGCVQASAYMAHTHTRKKTTSIPLSSHSILPQESVFACARALGVCVIVSVKDLGCRCMRVFFLRPSFVSRGQILCVEDFQD
jgi:hypothetical protein